MMLELMLHAAAGSLCLGLFIAATLWSLRVASPHLQRSAWCAVLGAALAMPLLMLLARSQPLELPAVAGAAVLRSTSQAAQRWQDSAFYVYLAMAAVLLARHGWALLQAFGLRRRAQRLDTPWARTLDARVSTEVAAPVSIGRTILLPAHFADWSEAQMRAVLAHESSHVQRHDFLLMNWLQLHRALFWFNPLAWWLPRRLGLINEHLSDDAALAALEDRGDYARMLLDFTGAVPVGTSISTPPPAPIPAPIIAMARPATVAQRVERIIAMDCIAPRPRNIARVSLVAAVVAPALFIAAQAQVVVRPAVLDRGPKSNPSMPLQQPEYPAESIAAVEEGTVILRLYVLENGYVADAAVKQSSGYPKLDVAAVQNALNWRLQPALANGKPIGAWGEFAVSFRLSD